MPELFAAQAARTPDAVALVCGEQSLSYRELDARANQLAHHLRALGVGPETMVALCVERSSEMVVGLLGILKAGGAYLPLDPDYPDRAPRLHAGGCRRAGAGDASRHCARGCRARRRAHGRAWTPTGRHRAAAADRTAGRIDPQAPPMSSTPQDRRANPKGVAVTHRSLAQSVCAGCRTRTELTPDDRPCCRSPFASTRRV